MGVSARRQRWGLLFTVPAVAFFAIFFLLPLGQTAYLSFTDYPLLGDPTWVGTDNYTALVHDRIFRESLITTGWYVVASAVPVSVLAIAMALVLQHPGRTRAVLTAAYFLPVVLSDVVVAIVWRYLLGQFGPINQALSVVDKGGLNLTADPELVPWTVVGITVWQWTGWTMLIYLAGLRTIPANVYEASRIDGANAWQTFRDITFPLLRPTIFFVVAISVITGAQSFGYQYIISNGTGGPDYATNVIALHIYNTAFRFLDAGYAAAMSMVLLVLLLGALVIQMRVYPSEAREP